MTYTFDHNSGPKVALLGDSYRILASREQTDGALAVVEVTVGPGHGVPPHIDHNEAIGWYILEGEMTFIVDEGERLVGPGGWIYSPKSVLHTFQNRTDKAVRAILLSIPAGLEGFFFEAGKRLADGETPSAPSEDDVAKAMSLAPKYGLEFLAG